MMWKGSWMYFNPDAWTVLHRISGRGNYLLRFVSDDATNTLHMVCWEEKGGRAQSSHLGNGRILAFPARLKEEKNKGKISESEIVLQGGKLKHVTWSQNPAHAAVEPVPSAKKNPSERDSPRGVVADQREAQARNFDIWNEEEKNITCPRASD